eukprot:gene31388-38770_t
MSAQKKYRQLVAASKAGGSSRSTAAEFPEGNVIRTGFGVAAAKICVRCNFFKRPLYFRRSPGGAGPCIPAAMIAGNLSTIGATECMMRVASVPRRPAFLDGGGECGERLRNFDWAGSRMGPPERWPACLQTVLRTVLGSRFPMAIHWGSELLTFYNDAFAQVLGSKHPGHLGRPAKEWWREMWDQMAPIVEHVLTGETYYVENASYAPERGHSQRETYFTHCHSPIWNEDNKVEGVLLVLTESTREVLAERAFVALNRRQAFQLDVADRLRGLGAATDVTAVATELLGNYLHASRVAPA